VQPNLATGIDGRRLPSCPSAMRLGNFKPLVLVGIPTAANTVIVSPWIRKGTVEHRMLQHTSVIRTVNEIFDLNGPLNHRDVGAQSFADLFEAGGEFRSAEDMPTKLNRASLEETVESGVAGVPLHPADEPLDELTREWAMGMLALLPGGLEAVEEVPTTQGEAAAAIQMKLEAAGL
jgi:hypothetical protein